MISIATAIKTILRNVDPIGVERIDLAGSVGRVLAEDVVADTDLPPFNRSQMDGFAIIAEDIRNTPVPLKIVGESAAGRGWHKRLNRGEAVRIMTGAPVPSGADSVIRVEQTSEQDGIVEVIGPVKKGESVVRKGAEIRKGKTVIATGEIITTNMIAALASFGHSKVKVARQPRVGMLATGSEIVDLTRKPGRDQIRNSNSPMLRALVESISCRPSVFPISRDDISSLRSTIRTAAKKNDILIITGGVSVGKYDLTKLALRELGAEIFFERVKLKPGKPTVFARLGKTLVFGLPGNPVSAAVTFRLFVRTAVRRMQGARDIQLCRGSAVLGKDAKAAQDRDTFLPATLATDKNATLIATPLRTQGSSDFVSFARVEALVFIKAGERYKMGDVLEIRLV